MRILDGGHKLDQVSASRKDNCYKALLYKVLFANFFVDHHRLSGIVKIDHQLALSATKQFIIMCLRTHNRPKISWWVASGKASVFGIVYRRFESYRPSQHH